jgi:hypothetical protein
MERVEIAIAYINPLHRYLLGFCRCSNPVFSWWRIFIFYRVIVNFQIWFTFPENTLNSAFLTWLPWRIASTLSSNLRFQLLHQYLIPPLLCLEHVSLWNDIYHGDFILPIQIKIFCLFYGHLLLHFYQLWLVLRGFSFVLNHF